MKEVNYGLNGGVFCLLTIWIYEVNLVGYYCQKNLAMTLYFIETVSNLIFPDELIEHFHHLAYFHSEQGIRVPRAWTIFSIIAIKCFRFQNFWSFIGISWTATFGIAIKAVWSG